MWYIFTLNFKDTHNTQNLELLVGLIRKKAKNLFATKQLMCSEAVLTVVNRSLRGGLMPEVAIRLASGLPEGIGGSGCTCGALTGGVLSLGLFLGREKPGIFNSTSIMTLSKELHDRFKEKFGSTCCRVLSKNLEHGSKDHFERGSEIVGFSAELTSRIILFEIPNLIPSADWSYLEHLDSYVESALRKMAHSILH